jgi:hypothetical protein
MNRPGSPIMKFKRKGEEGRREGERKRRSLRSKPFNTL